MIVTKLENLQNYVSVNPNFADAFEALAALYKEPFEKGRHPVDGDRIFINALEYNTKAPEESLMEAHRAYVDVMLMVEGEEIIGVSDVDSLGEITMEYDPKGDALLAKLEPGYQTVHMKKGSVCILFPEDAHAPGMNEKAPCAVKKFVQKVAIG